MLQFYFIFIYKNWCVVMIYVDDKNVSDSFVNKMHNYLIVMILAEITLQLSIIRKFISDFVWITNLN